MEDQVIKTLREPFKPEQIGKLPKISCSDCSNAVKNRQGKACGKHNPSKCRECDNWITNAHIHVDYVNHAYVTDRLNKADPEWTWEPMGFDQNGLPALDANGGLWIRMTIDGVTRPGYGDAGTKRGGDATKEVIGDAIKNAAMRFGVALDLWAKGDLPEDDEPAAPQPAPEPTVDVTNIIDKQLDQLERVYLKGHWTYPFKASAVPKSMENEVTTLIESCIGAAVEQPS